MSSLSVLHSTCIEEAHGINSASSAFIHILYFAKIPDDLMSRLELRTKALKERGNLILLIVLLVVDGVTDAITDKPYILQKI